VVNAAACSDLDINNQSSMICAAHAGDRSRNWADIDCERMVDPQQTRTREEVGPCPAFGSRDTSSIATDLGQQLVLAPRGRCIHVTNDHTCAIALTNHRGNLRDLSSPFVTGRPPREIDGIREMHVEYVKRLREIWPIAWFEPSHPP